MFLCMCIQVVNCNGCSGINLSIAIASSWGFESLYPQSYDRRKKHGNNDTNIPHLNHSDMWQSTEQPADAFISGWLRFWQKCQSECVVSPFASQPVQASFAAFFLWLQHFILLMLVLSKITFHWHLQLTFSVFGGICSNQNSIDFSSNIIKHKGFVFIYFVFSRQAKPACPFTVQEWRWRRRSLRVGLAGCGTGEERLIRNQRKSRREVWGRKEAVGWRRKQPWHNTIMWGAGRPEKNVTFLVRWNFFAACHCMFYMCLDVHGCKLQVDWCTTAWQQLCFTPPLRLSLYLRFWWAVNPRWES